LQQTRLCFGAWQKACFSGNRCEADSETVIADIISGQYKKPVRVVAFNTAGGWARDVAQDIAREFVDTSEPLSNSARDFVDRVANDCHPISR
jgi:hypothetical protein